MSTQFDERNAEVIYVDSSIVVADPVVNNGSIFEFNFQTGPLLNKLGIYNPLTHNRIIQVFIDSYFIKHYADETNPSLGFQEADRTPLAIQCPQIVQGDARSLVMLINDAQSGLQGASTYTITDRVIPGTFTFTLGVLNNADPYDQTLYACNQPGPFQIAGLDPIAYPGGFLYKNQHVSQLSLRIGLRQILEPVADDGFPGIIEHEPVPDPGAFVSGGQPIGSSGGGNFAALSAGGNPIGPGGGGGGGDPPRQRVGAQVAGLLKLGQAVAAPFMGGGAAAGAPAGAFVPGPAPYSAAVGIDVDDVVPPVISGDDPLVPPSVVGGDARRARPSVPSGFDPSLVSTPSDLTATTIDRPVRADPFVNDPFAPVSINDYGPQGQVVAGPRGRRTAGTRDAISSTLSRLGDTLGVGDWLSEIALPPGGTLVGAERILRDMGVQVGGVDAGVQADGEGGVPGADRILPGGLRQFNVDDFRRSLEEARREAMQTNGRRPIVEGSRTHGARLQQLAAEKLAAIRQTAEEMRERVSAPRPSASPEARIPSAVPSAPAAEITPQTVLNQTDQGDIGRGDGPGDDEPEVVRADRLPRRVPRRPRPDEVREKSIRIAGDRKRWRDDEPPPSPIPGVMPGTYEEAHQRRKRRRERVTFAVGAV